MRCPQGWPHRTGKIDRNLVLASFGKVRRRSVREWCLPYPRPADKVVAGAVVHGVGGVLDQLLAQALGSIQGQQLGEQEVDAAETGIAQMLPWPFVIGAEKGLDDKQSHILSWRKNQRLTSSLLPSRDWWRTTAIL